MPPGERPTTSHPPGFQRLQAATAMPLLSPKGLHQLLMTTQHDACGAGLIRGDPPEETLLKLRQPWGAPRCSPPLPLPSPFLSTHTLAALGPGGACPPPLPRASRARRAFADAAQPAVQRCTARTGENEAMAPMPDGAPWPRHGVDQSHGRSAVIRSLVLCADGTPTQRAAAPPTHPDPVRPCARRFPQQGLLGLVPGARAVVPRGRAAHVPEAVRQEMARRTGLSAGLHARALVRMLCATLADRIEQKTGTQRWPPRPGTTSAPREIGASPPHPDRAHARWQAIPRSAPGGHTGRISRCLHVSRPTVERWIPRGAEAHLAGLVDHHPGPPSPRKVGLAVLVEGSPRHKRPPDAGACRRWRLRARPDLSVRPLGRLMARNTRGSVASPPGRTPAPTQEPHPHPCNAQRPPQSWGSDGRRMDGAFPGITWWSRILLDGDARTMLAGAVAPAEARGVALPVVESAGLREGAPAPVRSESGGASRAEDVAAVCRRWPMDPATLVRTQGPSALPLLATPCHSQRRRCDSPLSLTQTPVAGEQGQHTFRPISTSTAQHGLRQDPCAPPLPLHVLGEAQGRLSTPDARTRTLSRALFPRTTHPYGGGTRHRAHGSVDEG